MLLSLLAATFSFTATATGVAKGTPVEFMFVGPGSDREYEAMFVLDQSVDEFCKGIEKAGIPRGKPVNVSVCNLWPVGVPLTLEPAMADFIETKMPPQWPLGELIYTGGTRLANGSCEATTNMPLSVLSMYTLAQSPLVFNGIYEQGAVYNCHLAKEVKKGTKVAFSLTWDERSKTTPLSVTFRHQNAKEILQSIRAESQKGPVEVLVDFDPEMKIREAESVARALAEIESGLIKFNGCPDGHLFFHAFMPLQKWRDRQERLTQPFEFELLKESERLLYIEEDWTVEGNDPKLTPKTIAVTEAKNYPETNTCFIFADPGTKLSRVYEAIAKLKDSAVKVWYVFMRIDQSALAVESICF